MAFYISPPNGKVSLANLEVLAQKRLDFLLKIAECGSSVLRLKDVVEATSSVQHSDCLIEGSRKDSISHFILRLASCSDGILGDFFVSAETSLFKHRLSCMTELELRQAIKPLRKLSHMIKRQSGQCHMELSQAISRMSEKLTYLTCKFDWKMLVSHYFEGAPNQCIVLPFQHCLHLVAKREVTVSEGMAYVPCSKLCEVLRDIFFELLSYGMVIAKKQYHRCAEDPRLKRLFSSLRGSFRQKYCCMESATKMGAVRFEDVDACSEAFPLCMSTLHETLRGRHRLPHHDRVQYTLFLKEIGMPVNEALQFWRQEYQKPSCHGNTCKHDWDKERRRYVYSVRHLYGLEGSRVNYRAHCCNSIQKRSGMTAGGCPFKHADQSHLVEILVKQGLSHAASTEIAGLASEGAFQAACTLHLKTRLPPSGRSTLNQGRPNSQNIQITDNYKKQISGFEENSPLFCDKNKSNISTAEYNKCQEKVMKAKSREVPWANVVGNTAEKVGTDILHTGHKVGTGILPASRKLGTDILPASRKVGTDILHVGHKVGTDILHTGHKVGTDILHVGQKVGTGILHTGHKVGSDILHADQKVGSDILPASRKVGTDILHTGQKVGTDILHTGHKVGTGILHTGHKVGTGILHTGEKVGTDILHTGHKVGSDILHTGHKVGSDILHTGHKVGTDILHTGHKVGTDILHADNHCQNRTENHEVAEADIRLEMMKRTKLREAKIQTPAREMSRSIKTQVNSVVKCDSKPRECVEFDPDTDSLSSDSSLEIMMNHIDIPDKSCERRERIESGDINKGRGERRDRKRDRNMKRNGNVKEKGDINKGREENRDRKSDQNITENGNVKKKDGENVGECNRGKKRNVKENEDEMETEHEKERGKTRQRVREINIEYKSSLNTRTCVKRRKMGKDESGRCKEDLVPRRSSEAVNLDVESDHHQSDFREKQVQFVIHDEESMDLFSDSSDDANDSDTSECQDIPHWKIDSIEQTAESVNIQTAESVCIQTAESECIQTAESECIQTAESDYIQTAESECIQTAESDYIQTAELEYIQTAESVSHQTAESDIHTVQSKSVQTTYSNEKKMQEKDKNIDAKSMDDIRTLKPRTICQKMESDEKIQTAESDHKIPLADSDRSLNMADSDDSNIHTADSDDRKFHTPDSDDSSIHTADSDDNNIHTPASDDSSFHTADSDDSSIQTTDSDDSYQTFGSEDLFSDCLADEYFCDQDSEDDNITSPQSLSPTQPFRVGEISFLGRQFFKTDKIDFHENEGCFEHKNCHSVDLAISEVKGPEIRLEEKRSATPIPVITKPSHFYLSYQRLVQGLQAHT